jgi:hypothetical protein
METLTCARCALRLFDNLVLPRCGLSRPSRVLEDQGAIGVTIMANTGGPLVHLQYEQPLDRKELTLNRNTPSRREP